MASQIQFHVHQVEVQILKLAKNYNGCFLGCLNLKSVREFKVWQGSELNSKAKILRSPLEFKNFYLIQIIFTETPSMFEIY